MPRLIAVAGKTHTIQGSKADPGLLPRIIRSLFERVQSDVSGKKFGFTVSYLEIYNERIFDLLSDGQSAASTATSGVISGGASNSLAASQQAVPPQQLKMQEDDRGTVFVTGLREVDVSSPEEAFYVLAKGQQNRAVAETQTNQLSSRSHCVFTIKMYAINKKRNDFWAKLSVVDLAGSERSQRTNNSGQRLKEAVKINTSLMTLGRCLETLRWNQQHPDQKPQVLLTPFDYSCIDKGFCSSLICL